MPYKVLARGRTRIARIFPRMHHAMRCHRELRQRQTQREREDQQRMEAAKIHGAMESG